eukprot:scaffold15528_cov159-Skeletonema_marinoi.AAC.1
MPRGFKQPGKCLRLLKSLYGLRQAPRLFWKYLTKSMEECGLKQSCLDPCLFIGEKVVAVCYVDDRPSGPQSVECSGIGGLGGALLTL